MKLIVLTRQFGEYTGATISTLELLKRLKEHFEEIVVLTFKTDGSTIPGIRINQISRIKEIKSSVMEITNNNFKDWLGYSDDHLGFFLGNYGIRFVHTYHGNWPDVRYQSFAMFLKSLIFIPMYRSTIKRATVTVSVSKYMQKRFVTKYTQNSVVIYNGIKNQKTNSEKQAINSGQGFLMVGNVDKRKYKWALPVFEQLKEQGFNSPIAIYGPTIDKRIAYQLTQFKFVSMLGKQASIPYKDYSCLLSTSSSENLPVSIAEAISAGLPVISFDVGGIDELVTSENGITIAPKQFKQMAKKIMSLTTNQSYRKDSHLPSAFDWDNAATKYLQLFTRLEGKC